MHVLARIYHGFTELILPASCAACAALTDEEAPLCVHCAKTLEPIARPCARCGVPLPDEAPSLIACLACAAAPPRWRAARAPFVFGGELAVAIRRWKIARHPELSAQLGRLLAPSVAKLPSGVDALVPVPLHRHRLRDRGFNQASLLARAARRRGVDPPVAELLDRVRDTPTQSTLEVGKRRSNVRGAFAATSRRDLDGAHVVLVDDVMTTGSTASACAQALLAGGAARVDVLTLARALP